MTVQSLYELLRDEAISNGLGLAFSAYINDKAIALNHPDTKSLDFILKTKEKIEKHGFKFIVATKDGKFIPVDEYLKKRINDKYSKSVKASMKDTLLNFIEQTAASKVIEEESTCTVDKWGHKRWYNKENQLHRLDGPAVEHTKGKFWFINDKEYSEEEFNKVIKQEESICTIDKEGCTIDKEGNKTWRNKAGQVHRLDGPAIECANGYKEWWINDKVHRTDGPAIIYPYGREGHWYKEGKLVYTPLKYLWKNETKFVKIILITCISTVLLAPTLTVLAINEKIPVALSSKIIHEGILEKIEEPIQNPTLSTDKKKYIFKDGSSFILENNKISGIIIVGCKSKLIQDVFGKYKFEKEKWNESCNTRENQAK